MLAIDKTLGDHTGTLIADVGGFWAHANARSGIAHDSLLSNSICPSGAPYPIAWRRVKKKAPGPPGEWKEHTAWCLERSNAAMARGLPGDCTFDRSCTRAKGLHHIERSQRASGGDLQRTRTVVYDGREQSLQAVARQRPWQAKKPVRLGSRRDGYFRKQRRIPDVRHPVRMVVFWQERDAAEARKALGSHRLTWEGIRLGWVSRHRWTGTEPFPRDGKQEVGLGDCPGRSGAGPTRHVSLVSAAYSLLRRALPQNRPQEWARIMLTPIGEACRAVTGELLTQLVDWIVDTRADDHWSVPQMKAVLAQTSPHSI